MSPSLAGSASTFSTRAVVVDSFDVDLFEHRKAFHPPTCFSSTRPSAANEILQITFGEKKKTTTEELRSLSSPL